MKSVFLQHDRIRQMSAAELGFSRSSMTFAEATKFSCIYMHNECIPSWIMVISESLMLKCAVYYFLSGTAHGKSDQSLCVLYTAVKQQVDGTARHMDCFSSFTVFFTFPHQSQPPAVLPWYKNLVCELYTQWTLFCIIPTVYKGNTLLCELNYSWHPISYLSTIHVLSTQ